MRSFALVASLICSTVLLAHRTDAVIISTTGAMTETTGPISLLDGVSESSSEILIIDEGVSLLAADIFVNAVGPGLHTSAGTPVPITAGTLVQTYIVHFDPDGGVVSLTGGVVFEPGQIILGIQTHTPLLDGADGVVGDPSITYPTGLLTFRAFESLPGLDTVTIDPSLEAASFALIAELGIDQARIVTTVIPEPSTAALLALGMTWLGLRRR